MEAVLPTAPPAGVCEVTWPSWFALVPSLGPDVLVVSSSTPPSCRGLVVANLDAAPAHVFSGVLLADAGRGDAGRAAALVGPGGWLCVGGPSRRRQPRGFAVAARYVPIPNHRRPLATLPVSRGGVRLLMQTLFLPYAPAGRARRARRALMIALPVVLARVPGRVWSWVLPSQVVLLRRNR